MAGYVKQKVENTKLQNLKKALLMGVIYPKNLMMLQIGIILMVVPKQDLMEKYTIMKISLMQHLVMIVVILIQEPRTGGVLGIAFGGGVENVIGVKTAPTFFTNLTIGLGAAFGILAFLLSMMSGARTGSTSVVAREAGKGTVYKVLQELQRQAPPQPGQGGAVAPATPVKPPAGGAPAQGK